jgi:hypothetical protein
LKKIDLTVAIHQPNFLPWSGYFYKIAKSDVFVLLDDVQYTKNSFINRNLIKTYQGSLWITIPVMHSGKFGQLINGCRIQNKSFFSKKILKTIHQNYFKAPFYDYLFPELEGILNTKDESLVDLNITLIELLCKKLELNTNLLRSSDLHNVEGESTDRLISICKCLDATTYLFGFGAINYQDKDLFAEKNIEAKKTSFIHPTYNQLWGDFIPNLSVIDLLLNVGPDSKRYFK